MIPATLRHCAEQVCDVPPDAERAPLRMTARTGSPGHYGCNCVRQRPGLALFSAGFTAVSAHSFSIARSVRSSARCAASYLLIAM